MIDLRSNTHGCELKRNLHGGKTIMLYLYLNLSGHELFLEKRGLAPHRKNTAYNSNALPPFQGNFQN